jgi:hypothetical protein
MQEDVVGGNSRVVQRLWMEDLLTGAVGLLNDWRRLRGPGLCPGFFREVSTEYRQGAKRLSSHLAIWRERAVQVLVS